MNYTYLIISFFSVVFCFVKGHAQNPHHGDWLSAAFHQNRRAQLRALMPPNSVAVFFANPIRNRSSDVDFIYHQDPNFFYLTGHSQPHSLLLVFKEKTNIDGDSTDEVLFVRGRDASAELYEGSRIAPEEAEANLKIDRAYVTTAFEHFNLDFSQFDKVLFDDFHDDYRDHPEKGDLYELVGQFKEKAGYAPAGDMVMEPKASNLNVVMLDSIMTVLRGVKMPEEISLLRKAAAISALAQAEVMKAMKPGMSEAEVQGLHEFIFKKYRAEHEGYPSIVGAGHNGCVLHYIDNDKPEMEDGEMILMDLGAEYHGYTADVTRTIPVSGTFSREQRIIYDLVYKAQEAAISTCRAGVEFRDLYQATANTINRGLTELGLYNSTDAKDIIDPETARNRYYPHGCCHHIGLDVHDKGEYDVLEEHMVITIEPGIYIPQGSPADEKWWNIAVRIEDDFLVKKGGCEWLSDKAPRKAHKIEKLMMQPSPFDALVLPPLEDR